MGHSSVRVPLDIYIHVSSDVYGRSTTPLHSRHTVSVRACRHWAPAVAFIVWVVLLGPGGGRTI
jgi:hypothetical protein